MIYEVKNQSLKEKGKRGGGKGTGYFYFNVSFPSKHKIPLSFEKRGCVQSDHMSRQTINEILRERRAMTPAMALRLSRLFGNTPEFWLNAQRAYDLWHAQKSYQRDIKRIKPMRTA